MKKCLCKCIKKLNRLENFIEIKNQIKEQKIIKKLNSKFHRNNLVDVNIIKKKKQIIFCIFF